MRRTEDRGRGTVTAGVMVCQRLYESLEPALSCGRLSGFPVEIWPRQCSGDCINIPGFDEAASRLSQKCSRFCVLTCSCPDNSSFPDYPGERLIATRQGAELLLPLDIISEKQSAGEIFLFPSKSPENKEYLSFLQDSCKNSTGLPSGIIIPDTGAGAVTEEFIREIENITDIPAQVEKTGLDFFESYLGSRLYETGYDLAGLEVERSVIEKGGLKKELSDSLMAMDMLGLLVGLKDEENVIETTIELISTLCSPEQVVYAGVRNNRIESVFKLKPKSEVTSCIDLPPGSKVPDISENPSGDGFVLPVSVWGEIVGLLSVEGIGSCARTESHKNTVLLFLPLCGLVVKNARNYYELEAALYERDEEIELRKQAEEGLSGAIRKLNLLSGVTRHDILNQIIIANYYLETAIEDSPEWGETLSPVKKSIDEIHRQIEFTKNYQDLGVSPPSWQNAPGLIRRCFDERVYPAGVEVAIDLPETEFLADAMLGKAFCNVISNAYNHAEGMKHLKITGRPVDDSFLLTIADDGEGVPEDKKELIFRRGHGKNHGYGLFLVKEILGLTGIIIRETGMFGDGAVFEIVIPPGSWRNTGAV